MTAFRSTGCDETPGSGGCGSAGNRSEISFRFEVNEDGNEPETRAALVADYCGGGSASEGRNIDNGGDGLANSASAQQTASTASRQLSIPRVELGPDEDDDSYAATAAMMSDNGPRNPETRCDQSPQLGQHPTSIRTSATALNSGSGGASVTVEMADRRLLSTTGVRRLGARHAIRSSVNAVTTVADGGGGESLQVPTVKRAGCNSIYSQRQSLLGRPVCTTPRRGAANRRRDARYRRCQARLYNFLERPKNWRSILYHLLV